MQDSHRFAIATFAHETFLGFCRRKRGHIHDALKHEKAADTAYHRLPPRVREEADAVEHEARAQANRCDDDTEGTYTKLARFFAVGVSHGLQGWYPDGDYSSDADWCYGIGAEIQELEAKHEIDDGAFGDVYVAGHGVGLTVKEACDASEPKEESCD